MMTFAEILILSLFIEAVVSAVKPLWSEDRMSVTEIVSIVIGIAVAVACRINMLDFFLSLRAPAWMDYVLYAMTGIGLGRGPSFLYDLWQRIRALPATDEEPPDAEDEEGPMGPIQPGE